MSNSLNHARLKEMAKELGRPLYTLETLRNDPFTAEVPARKAGAEWFAQLWAQLDIQPGVHMRRVHYQLISQDPPIRMLNGEPYINTDKCEGVLERTSLDARYLGLIPGLVDRRNAEPMIRLVADEDSPAAIETRDGYFLFERPDTGIADLAIRAEVADPSIWANLGNGSGIGLPRLTLIDRPHVAQRYHIEIWCEKSTMNDVLQPLGRRYGVNIITGTGEQSETQCVALVDRALQSGLPVRILFLSDFDPGGQSMPVATARKIEFELYKRDLKDALDIQLRPIVLTFEQCQAYALPRTPLKVTETRAARFEERFGEGATELDALEALYPGELTQILEREIERYHDATLNHRVRQAAQAFEQDLSTITAEVRQRHTDEIAEVERLDCEAKEEIRRMSEEASRLTGRMSEEASRLTERIREELERTTARLREEAERTLAPMREELEHALAPIRARIAEIASAIEERALPLIGTMREELEAEAPDVDDWPEPDVDEDPDPLFDSSRDYVEQIDRYKLHQGKPTEAPPRKKPQPFEMKCERCGVSFMATRRDTKPFCGRRCRDAGARARRSSDQRGPACR